MKERPILFKGEMVNAIIEGRKTQTRRIMKPQPILENGLLRWVKFPLDICLDSHSDVVARYSPYGHKGDVLWVRECFSMTADGHVHYKATDMPVGQWKPSIHMPKYLSRITLEVTDVRVERIQDISDEDAKAEGVTPVDPNGEGLASYIVKRTGNRHKPAFSMLWDDINEPRGYGWDANPWVWVVTFRKVEA